MAEKRVEHCMFCEWGEQQPTPNGYYCPVCKREYTWDMMIVCDQEQDEKETGKQNQNG